MTKLASEVNFDEVLTLMKFDVPYNPWGVIWQITSQGDIRQGSTSVCEFAAPSPLGGTPCTLIPAHETYRTSISSSADQPPCKKNARDEKRKPRAPSSFSSKTSTKLKIREQPSFQKRCVVEVAREVR